MSIATEKDKAASNRFALVRLNPARHISNDLVLDSGIVYTMTFPFVPVNNVTRNGVDLTEITSGTPVADEWIFDESTKELKVGITAGPDDEDRVIVAFYLLFYTGETTRYLPEDPEDSNSTTREWLGRLTAYPKDKQTMRNITQGVFSIADIRVELSNPDDDFQQFLTIEDSFSNKDVDVWQVINDVTNIRHSFQGKVKGPIRLSDKVVMPVFDVFSLLSQPALFGDPIEDAYYRREAASFPGMDPSKSEEPILYMIGRANRVTTSNFLGGSPTAFPEIDFRIVDGNEGVITNFNSNAATTNNRLVGICRVSAGTGSIASQTFGTIEAFADGLGIGRRFIRFSAHTANVGEKFEWTEGGTPFSGVIGRADDFVHSSVTYNIDVTEIGTFSLSSTMSNSTKIGVCINSPSFSTPVPLKGGSFGALGATDHFTLDAFTRPSGNKFIRMTLDDNFEASFSQFGGSPFDPTKHTINFRVYPNRTVTHAGALQNIVEAAGMTANAASFTAADAALTANAYFTIPQFDENDFKNYLEYAQLLLKSTLGILRLNTDQEVVYELLATPSSTDITDNVLALQGRTSVSVDYNDITTSLIGFNPHANDRQNLDAAEASATATSNKAEFLHGIENVTRFRHVLENIDGRIADILKVKRSRRAIYRFTTATDNIDSDIGSDLQLDNGIVLGGTGSVDLKITGLDRSPNRTIVTADDLGELD